MRALTLACCVLVCMAGAARAGDDAAAAVRKCSERYTAAVLKQNKAAIEELLHKSYRGQDLLGALGRPQKADAVAAVAHWTSAEHRFRELVTNIERIETVGDTAIETGSASGSTVARSSGAIFSEVTYTRVWVKVGTGWRLVYERY